MRITRYPSLSEPQFFGCVGAFIDSLSGELNSASAALRRLESQKKGAAFAFEMALDRHRYGAAIVLERWGTLAGAFGSHLPYERARAIIEAAPERVRAAENILEKLNRLLDVTDAYSGAVVESSLLALQSIEDIFVEERRAAEQDAKLGPMLSEEYTSARRIFSEDLAQR